MKPIQITSVALIALFSLSIFAGPAPWYKWQSKLNGKITCAQTSPGDGWKKYGGPYKDARCEQPGTRG